MPTIGVTRTDKQVVISGERPALTYNLVSPPDSGLPMQTGGYFHPICTPRGICVTDFAPDDHRHHRGLFFAWVEVHGERPGDFWGWGMHAPCSPIVNRSIETTSDGFFARNSWMVDETELISEELTVKVELTKQTLIDLEYSLTPQSETRISHWAFSGFCLRLRKDAEVTYYSPNGPALYDNPIYTEPTSDWPDSAWYGAELMMGDGTLVSAAVLNHPENPPSLWHNHRDARMINPCSIAPREVVLLGGQEQVFRYRVVVFDGHLMPGLLASLLWGDCGI